MKVFVVLVAGAAAVEGFNKKQYMEESIISSLGNCPLCAGHEQCLGDCRRKDQRSWSDCLSRCLSDNPMLTDTLSSMITASGESLSSFGA
mmetsp:Transcript_4859/g.10683  ORF Transcript_4859/g.10683 Transcript_4859/m.10683 type:complete len:90 (+) Transcript_4859:59-328(+)